jgi:asparagine synthase (glutamine-hydrolysing)
MRVFDDVVWHMDEPIANHVQPATYLLAQVARPYITVALGGDGGDELFGGYTRYWYQAMIERARRFGGAYVAHLLESLGVTGRVGRLARLIAQPLGSKRHLSFLLQKEATIRGIRSDISTQASLASLQEIFDPLFQPMWHDRVNQSMAVDVQTWLADESLMRTDKMTMAHGLEQRVPLLDLEVVRLAQRIPSRWKVGSRAQGKRILIDAWRDALPEQVLAQEKRAFMSPAAKWIRGPLHGYMQTSLSELSSSGLFRYFNATALDALLRRHVEVRQYNLHLLWAVCTLQRWHKRLLGD